MRCLIVSTQSGWRPVSFDRDEYSNRTLDFVQRLQLLTKCEESRDLIIQELGRFGFSGVTSLSIPGPGSNLQAQQPNPAR
jgi:hypothetical protein